MSYRINRSSPTIFSQGVIIEKGATGVERIIDKATGLATYPNSTVEITYDRQPVPYEWMRPDATIPPVSKPRRLVVVTTEYTLDEGQDVEVRMVP